MKRKSEKMKKKEGIKLSKFNIRLNIGCLVLVVLYIVNNIILYFNNSYAYFFITHILNNINGLFYYLNSNINYLSIVGLGIYALLVLIDVGVDIYYENFSKAPYEKRAKIVNIFYTIFVCATVVTLLPSYMAQFENHLPNFDELYFKETKDKSYQVDDLISLDEYLQKKVLLYADSIERDDNNLILADNTDYNKQAIKDLKNIDDDIKLLKGLYPRKSSQINDLMRGYLGSKVVGFTTPYNTYFDYNATSTSIMNTITHEFCHTKGIVRENETVYCSFLAGVKSDNVLSNYSAYIEAFSWVSEALLALDKDTSDKLEDEVLSKCLINDYPELCGIYTKNNKEYIKGSKVMRIVTYRLKNYINDTEEFEKSLSLLSSNGAKIYVNEEEKSVQDIMDLISNKSELKAVIVMDISKNSFEKIKESIRDDRLFLSIYQENKVDKTAKKRENNPVEYYLAPFKDKDENMLFNGTYGSVEYDYSRVARLLLEHYEKEGYSD